MNNSTKYTPEYFAEMGVDHVRFGLTRQNLDEEYARFAVAWLAEQDRVERAHERHFATQTQKLVKVAICVSIVAALISVAAWLLPMR